MAEQYSNQAHTTLASGIDNSTNTVVLTDASKFPATGMFTIVCEDELMLVVSRSGATLTKALRARSRNALLFRRAAVEHRNAHPVPDVLADPP